MRGERNGGTQDVHIFLESGEKVKMLVKKMETRESRRPLLKQCPYHWAVQFSSVTQLCPTLCNPMNHSTPGLPVHHQLLEFTQTHVHWVGDAIQPSHPLSSPSTPALNLSQHQGLFQWVSSLHQVAKVLEFQLQHESFQWTLWGWIMGRGQLSKERCWTFLSWQLNNDWRDSRAIPLLLVAFYYF